MTNSYPPSPLQILFVAWPQFFKTGTNPQNLDSILNIPQNIFMSIKTTQQQHPYKLEFVRMLLLRNYLISVFKAAGYFFLFRKTDSRFLHGSTKLTASRSMHKRYRLIISRPVHRIRRRVFAAEGEAVARRAFVGRFGPVNNLADQSQRPNRFRSHAFRCQKFFVALRFFTRHF